LPALYGGGRARDYILDQEKEKLKLDELLLEPAKNFQKIKSVFLHPKSKDISHTLAMLEKKGNSEKLSHEDADALHVLQAETIHASLISLALEHRKQANEATDNSRKPSGEKTWAGISNEAYDRIYSLLPQLVFDYLNFPEKSTYPYLRIKIAMSINGILQRNFSKSLPEKTRCLIVEKYLEAPEDPLAKCPPTDVILIHRKLLCMERLEKKCILALGDSTPLERLFFYLKVANIAMMDSTAMKLAESMHERIRNNNALYEKEKYICYIIRVYSRIKPENAMEIFKKESLEFPLAKYELYRVAKITKQYPTIDECRSKWLYPCLDGLISEYTFKKYGEEMKDILLREHKRIIFELKKENDCETALCVLDRVYKLPIQLEHFEDRLLMVLKIECYKQLGQTKEMEETFREYHSKFKGY